MRTFSIAVRRGRRLKSWKTKPTRPARRAARRSSSSAPSASSRSVTSPCVGLSSPARSASSVVLPEPDGPRMARASPATTASSMSRRMASGPSGLLTSLPRAFAMTGDVMRVLTAVFVGMILILGAGSAQATDARPVLLVVGDSLSAAYKIPVEKGWVHLLAERLEQRGYDYRVVNASTPGDTSAAGLARLPDELKRYRPAIVVIEFGGNDGLQGLSPDQMRSNLAQMVTLSQRAGAKVLLIGVRVPPNYGPVFAKRFGSV